MVCKAHNDVFGLPAIRTRCICKRVGRARLHGMLLRGPLGDAKAWLHVRADVSVFNMDDIIIVQVNHWG